MKKTLFEISEELLGLDALLDDAEGDDEGQQAILEGYLGTLEQDLEQKLDNYCALIAELEARAAARKTEADRMIHSPVPTSALSKGWLNSTLRRSATRFLSDFLQRKKRSEACWSFKEAPITPTRAG